MPFKKDDPRINKKGRPKGSANKTAPQLREFLAGVLTDNQDKFKTAIAKLDNKEFARTYLEAMQYVAPKLKSIEITDLTTLEEFLLMTPEERTEKLNELKAKLNGSTNKK